jgi:hypothetical protein
MPLPRLKRWLGYSRKPLGDKDFAVFARAHGNPLLASEWKAFVPISGKDSAMIAVAQKHFSEPGE